MLTRIVSIRFPVFLLGDPHVEMLLVSLESDRATFLLQLLVEIINRFEDQGLHCCVTHDLALSVIGMIRNHNLRGTTCVLISQNDRR